MRHPEVAAATLPAVIDQFRESIFELEVEGIPRVAASISNCEATDQITVGGPMDRI